MPLFVLLEQVSYFYPQAARPALLDVDFTIEAGEIVGLVGATGAGKTTLCLALNGIVPQLHGGRFFGRVTVNGLDTVDHPIHEFARHVGLVLQEPESQLVTSSVENEVAFALENFSVPRDEIRRRVDAALAAVQLDGVARKHPHELSGGQQQRLALAAALAQRPALVVLDEPTAQLDPRSTAEVFQLIRRLNRDHGTAFLITGHASEHLAETVHRLVVLSAGQVVRSGSPATIFRDTVQLAKEKIRPPDVTATFDLLRTRGVTDQASPITLADGLAALRKLPPSTAFNPPREPLPSGLTPILSVQHVSHVYADGTRALDDVSLSIHRGDYLAILGQNGAGKSTLLKHLLRLLLPASGEVLLDGRSIAQHSMAELAQRIGYVSQNPDRQVFNPTVEQEVSFALQQLPLSAGEKKLRVETVLASLQLTAHRQAHPFSLSKGDRARVVIAAVLVMNPEVLVFDEPTTGQDDAGARAILDLTGELQRQGRTIVVVTHHLNLLPGYAQRAVVMGAGRVLADGPLREIFHAGELLAQTHLAPTQVVSLAQAAHPGNRALGPAELAATFFVP